MLFFNCPFLFLFDYAKQFFTIYVFFTPFAGNINPPSFVSYHEI